MRRLPFVVLSLSLSAAPLAADVGPAVPWRRTRVVGPDAALSRQIDETRPGLAAVGGGPAYVAEFYHPDGKPLDPWNRRSGPFDHELIATWSVTALSIATAVALGGLWLSRRGRRGRG